MSKDSALRESTFLSEQGHLAPLSEKVLSYVQSQGADQAAIHMSVNAGYEATGRDNLLEGVDYYHSQGATIAVYCEHASGTVTTSDLREDALFAACDRAMAIARHTEPDPYQGLADKTDLATDFPDLALFHTPVISPQEAATQIPMMGERIQKMDNRISSVSDISMASSQSFSLRADTHGFCASLPTSSYSTSVGVVAEDASGMQRDYDYTTHHDPSALLPWETVAQRAVDKAVKRLGARCLPTQKAAVIYTPSMARTLIGHFLSAIKGVALYKGRSFLLDQLNQPVFSDNVTIQQMPLVPGLPGSRAYDGDGVATENAVIVEEGVLQRYLLGVYSGRRLGMRTTGNANGPLNVQIKDHGQDQAGLIEQMQRGLLVTELLGQGVNPVTGDYSRGACGFWVENGEIQFPVEEVVLSGNLRDMFARIQAVGNDIDWRSRIQTGSILLDGLTVAGA